MSTESKNIAVVGGGIAGLSAAWALSRHHHVTLIEQNAYLGGHSNTVDIDDNGHKIAVDTGFIVFNPPNYPYLVELFKTLEVETVETNMSFGVSMRDGTFEYAGSDLNGLFAQRGNLLKPKFWRMLNDVRRFYRSAPGYLQNAGGRSIGELLENHRFSEVFIDDHLMPMAAAIWSASREDIEKYPADAFIRFFANHGLLELGERPLWNTVKGGSREYVKRLVADTAYAGIVHHAAERLERTADGIRILCSDGESHQFDEAVLACHADEALSLLAQPSVNEQKVLGAFQYSHNEAVLHEDPALMPRRRAAWSSWNYIEKRPQATEETTEQNEPLCVSYWMNRLQALPTERDIIVTLNPNVEPDADKVLRRFQYTHPIFDQNTNTAQHASVDIQGKNRVWFCGSYLGHGFHEDGIQSGLWVAEQFNCAPAWQMASPFPRLPDSYHAKKRLAA